MEVNLREYQQESVNALTSYLHNKTGNPLLVLPTGSGKSHCQAGFIQQTLDRYPNTKILCLTHVKELIEQNVEKARLYMPGADIGIYSAGLGKRELDKSITFAGIQSIYNKEFKAPHLVMIDECHLVPKRGDGMYLQLLQRLIIDNPKLRVIGMTATPFRLRGGVLTGGDGKMFDSVVYDLPIQRLIDEGVLATVVSAEASAAINVSDVKVTAGEYNLKQLGVAADQDHVTASAVTDLLNHGKSRKSWLIFCVSVKHAEHVKEALIERGVVAECITGETPKDERKRILEAYKAGKIKALTNCNVLTTGFDAPEIDLIALLRPTISPGLYVQMVGRGMRPADGKDNCLVLDYGGNISRHGPVDNVTMPPPEGKGKGEAPVKFCPMCLAECHISAKECDECGHEFEMEEKELGKRASQLSILSSQKELTEYEVSKVKYVRHESHGSGKVSMRVDYYDGPLKACSEWVCLEHDGFAKHKAEAWWLKRDKYITDIHGVPPNVKEAVGLSSELSEPVKIYTRKEGKYEKIVRYDFD
tara:strand:+ start:205 stop:1797 length:1593 start_codon:yes stop_codon:yes gene_type:complete